jgi:integrase/recombinase XerC
VSHLPAIIPAHQPPAIPEVTDADVAKAWLESLSPNTRRAYGGDLRQFSVHCGTSGSSAAIELLLAGGPGAANRAVLSWRAAMDARGLSAATISRRIAALRSVVGLAGSLGRVNWSLTVRAPRVVALRDVRGPGRHGWRSIVAELERRTGAAAVRDLAIVRMLHDLMLRRSELVGLDVEHLELAAGKVSQIWIRGKGRTSRERLELPQSTAAAVGAWLCHRGLEPGPLFRGFAGRRLGRGRINAGTIARIVNRAGARAALDRRVAPHGLRHEAITRAIEMDLPLLDVQLSARHTDPRTTQRYIDRVKNPQPRVSRIIAEDS